ncbi:uncharacterized protein PODANS_4_7750 [Podospora anserina S mat+]|uniref:Podospora anserina S mat+ genomic DNA chromosome 4, supercontig 4 n=1 Tax=Podospora anserina (strain S / ATCC MYA-4624 / DSM 980 / FGSC 10383) TaxID=515849 RepID=B2ARE6_PODAN|nr:uncharacterized protein PODANS_4_7750 [Podospora anserina S mat+]CAP66724.1 unnamed protein product [Podospora anserina S mat+]CDP28459.1 Putative protein of unknown function [Podospora anserina S mat+]
MSKCIMGQQDPYPFPIPYWSDLSEEIFPSKSMHPPMLMGWSWPGLSGCINWQRHTPTHQEGHTLSRIFCRHAFDDPSTLSV